MDESHADAGIFTLDAIVLSSPPLPLLALIIPPNWRERKSVDCGYSPPLRSLLPVTSSVCLSHHLSTITVPQYNAHEEKEHKKVELAFFALHLLQYEWRLS